jgi:PPP family 3-phenylpropionic acid transporter
MSAFIMRLYYFAFFAKIGVVVPFMPLYYERLGMTALQIGILTSIMPLGRPLFAGAWTIPADRLGRRHGIMVLASWLAAAAFVLYLFPGSFAGLAVVTLVVAATHAPIHALAEAAVLDEVKKRALSYGNIRVWGSIGFVVAAGGLGWALSYFSIRLILWSAIAFAVMTAVSTHWLPRPVSEAPGRKTSLREFIGRPGVVSFYLAAMLMQASHGAYYTFYSIHMSAQGHSSTVIGALWVLGVVSEMIIMVKSRWLLTLGSSSSLLRACFAVSAIRWLLYAVTSSLWLAIPAQLMHAFTFGLFHLAAVTATHKMFPSDLRASGQAIYSGITFGLGSVVGSMLAGAAYEPFGARTLYGLCAVVAAIGGLLLAGASRHIPGLEAEELEPDVTA